MGELRAPELGVILSHETQHFPRSSLGYKPKTSPKVSHVLICVGPGIQCHQLCVVVQKSMCHVVLDHGDSGKAQVLKVQVKSRYSRSGTCKEVLRSSEVSQSRRDHSSSISFLITRPHDLFSHYELHSRLLTLPWSLLSFKPQGQCPNGCLCPPLKF